MPVGSDNITVPVTSSLTFSRNGVLMKSFDVGQRSARIEVTVEGTVFQVSKLL